MEIGRRHVLAGLAGAATVPLWGSTAAAAAPRSRPDPRRVHTGIEQLIASDYEPIRGQRVGLVSNPTGILPDLRHELDVMHQSGKVDLAAAFGPEHGFRGTEPPGGHDDFFIDPRTGIPVYNSYTAKNFAKVYREQKLDAVLFDIQDVGARFYTYIWTMYRSMGGAALAGCRYLVLDRPNPLTGLRALGPVLHPEYSSGVGLKPISQQHGMTVGELAQLFNSEFVPDEFGAKVDLEVVQMRRWRRDYAYADTRQPWVLPSPNMPTVDTAWVYPGTCMFEGTNLSEGRGTTRPFEIIGAPYVDYHWAGALNELDLPGTQFRETYFTPTFSKWEGETCGGVQVYVTDRDEFNALLTGIAMLVTAKGLYAKDFEWRSDNWIDLLTGSDYVRKAINAGKDANQVVAGWQDELDEFRRTRDKYLIYRKVHGHG